MSNVDENHGLTNINIDVDEETVVVNTENKKDLVDPVLLMLTEMRVEIQTLKANQIKRAEKQYQAEPRGSASSTSVIDNNNKNVRPKQSKKFSSTVDSSLYQETQSIRLRKRPQVPPLTTLPPNLETESSPKARRVVVAPFKKRKVKTSAPVRALNITPVREEAFDELDDDEAHQHRNEHPIEFFNATASQSDGYDSNDSLRSHHDEEDFLDLSKISCVPTEEDLGQPINQQLADIILKNWKSKKPFEAMKLMFEKYQCPENFSDPPPKVNLELWKLLSSWQRKSDIKFMSMQKSLKKVMNASALIFKEAQNEHVDVQKIAQITADMAAMLGQTSHEISLKRRVFIRSVINPEYKDLCSISQPVTTYLFGDDLPKLVKELNLTNKLSNKGNKYKSNKPYEFKNYRARPYYKRSSFLGRGRGNLPNQQWRQQTKQYQRK